MTFQSKEDLFSMNDHLQILKQNKKKKPTLLKVSEERQKWNWKITASKKEC